MAIENKRSLKDLNLSVTKALPAAGATNQSAFIDTAILQPGRVPRVELLIEVPATPSLVDTKTITFTIEESADGVNAIAANPDIPAQVVTGAGGVGAAAKTYQCKLPTGLKRFIRLSQAVLAAGGDNTAVSGTLSLIH